MRSILPSLRELRNSGASFKRSLGRFQSNKISFKCIPTQSNSIMNIILKLQARYNKSYYPVSEKARRLAWEKNFQMIQKHNEEHDQGIHTYRLELNHLADLVNITQISCLSNSVTFHHSFLFCLDPKAIPQGNGQAIEIQRETSKSRNHRSSSS